ncbi:MAG TPA: hypothetical protein VMT60_03980 [Candidatus Bathyarchaeia archaeon]|nr:hypothetical protein [Candidatus Bathyarchaeia archaeon]
MKAPHTSDGTDTQGRGLEIVIRIGPDGRVYLHDITADLVPIALAMNPDDRNMRSRLEAAQRFKEEGRK